MKFPESINKDKEKVVDKTVLKLNTHVELRNIPKEAHDYTVSGRSPLEWAAYTLKQDISKRGILRDPNLHERWKDDPLELVRHLRRLVHVGVRSAEIIASLPPSLTGPTASGDLELPAVSVAG